MVSDKCKKKIRKDALKMFMGCLIVFDLAIMLKYIAYQKISIQTSILLGQIGTVFGVLLGVFYYMEKIDIMKIIGIIIIILSSLYGRMSL